jgi:hypothetical protein
MLCYPILSYLIGSYLFTIDRASSRLNLVSPMSGAHTYAYDEEEQLWLSANSDRQEIPITTHPHSFCNPAPPHLFLILIRQ